MEKFEQGSHFSGKSRKFIPDFPNKVLCGSADIGYVGLFVLDQLI